MMFNEQHKGLVQGTFLGSQVNMCECSVAYVCKNDNGVISKISKLYDNDVISSISKLYDNDVISKISKLYDNAVIS